MDIRDDRVEDEKIHDAVIALRAALIPNRAQVDAAVKDLAEWVPEIGSPSYFQALEKSVGAGMYTEAEHQCEQRGAYRHSLKCAKAGCNPGSEDMPFLSEGFLYPLLGKEDARSLLARVHTLLEAVGYSRFTQWERFGL